MQEEVLQMALALLHKPFTRIHETPSRSDEGSPSEFIPMEIDNSGLLPVGTRVLRGPDWDYTDQDSHGVGTVVSHSDNGEYLEENKRISINTFA